MDSFEKYKQEIVHFPTKYNHLLEFHQLKMAFGNGYDHWFKLSEADRKAVDDTMEAIYDVTFTIDDVTDGPKMRRGKPTAFYLYGKPYTISSGLLKLLEAFDKAANLNKPEAVKILIRGLTQCHEGQTLEIYWRDCGSCPTIEQYLKNASDKAEGIVRIQAELMQLFSKNKTDYSSFTKKLSLYYQVLNDVMAYSNKEYQEANGVLHDLTEGTFTLPIIHAIEKEGLDPKLTNVLRMKTEDKNLMKFVSDLLEKHKSIEYCYNKLAEFEEDLKNEMKRLGGNPIFETLPDFAST